MARSGDHHTAFGSRAQLFAGLDWLSGGEMAARTRAFDWTRTALGPIAGWPQSLKTAFRIALRSHQPAFIWWGDQLIQLHNDACRALFEPRRPRAFGGPAPAIWHDIWNEIAPRLEPALQGRADDEMLFLMPGWDEADREEKFYLFSGSVIPDDEGRPGGLLCVNTDDTPRARLLEWEQSTRREAEHQREHLYSLLMQAPAIIVILRGRDYVIDLATPYACAAAGCPQEQVLKRPIFEVLPELEEAGMRSLLDAVMASGVPYTDREVPIPLDRARVASTPRFFNVVFAPLRNLQGAIDAVFVTASEVTEQVLARQHVEGLRADAETASRAKDDFLAMLGHELRNPLAPILTALQLIRQRGPERSAREQAVIERQVYQLTQLVNDLLDVARIARGTVELKKTRLDVSEVVGRAIETAAPLIEQRGHRLELDVARGLTLEADPARLSQVVANLLTNAAKYTEPGGSIRISGAREGDAVVIRVRDNGVGIAPEMRARIFDLFTRVRSSAERVHEGLGLGLAIVRNLVTLHGGTVWALSEGLGQGSEFVVRLPAGAAAAESERRPISGLLGPGTAARRATARVLIVDDNEDAARMLAEALEPVGYCTRVACNGPAALRAAADFRPDIALLDIGMPIMDGYELAARLRREAGLEQVRLVAITGYGLQADLQRSVASGFQRHLVKPIDIEALTAVLDGLRDGGD